MQITLNAHYLAHDEDGTVIVEVESRDLTPAEHKVLDNLFPDLESAVGMLLAKQAIMRAIR